VRAVLGLTLILVLARPAPLAAQWLVGVEGTLESVGGVSRSTQPGGASFGIHHPAWIGLRIESPRARVQWRAGVAYAAPSLALDAPEVTVIEHAGVTTVTALRAGVIVRLAQLQPGVALRVEAGPVLEWWRFESSATRLRGGGEIGLSLTVGLGGRFSGALGGFVGVTPVSPLEPADLPEGIEPRSAWRRALRGSVGLAL
jgi:hypothetical protein